MLWKRIKKVLSPGEQEHIREPQDWKGIWHKWEEGHRLLFTSEQAGRFLPETTNALIWWGNTVQESKAWGSFLSGKMDKKGFKSLKSNKWFLSDYSIFTDSRVHYLSLREIEFDITFPKGYKPGNCQRKLRESQLTSIPCTNTMSGWNNPYAVIVWFDIKDSAASEGTHKNVHILGGSSGLVGGNHSKVCFMFAKRLRFLERLWNQTLQAKWENGGKVGLTGMKAFIHSEKRNEGGGCAGYSLSSWWNEMHCGSKDKMKSFLIKVTPKKDAKNCITDFSQLDMDLANNERNTYKEIVSLEEISASQIKAVGKKTTKNTIPHKAPNMMRLRHLGYYIEQTFWQIVSETVMLF